MESNEHLNNRQLDHNNNFTRTIGGYYLAIGYLVHLCRIENWEWEEIKTEGEMYALINRANTVMIGRNIFYKNEE